MAAIVLNHAPRTRHPHHAGFWVNLIKSLRVALIMQNTQARTHAELMAEWRQAWREVDG